MDIYVLAGLITTMGLVNGIGLINNHKKVPLIDDKTWKNGTNSNIEKIKVDAEKEKVDAEKAKADADKAKADAEKAKVDAEKAKVDAEKAKVDAEKSKAEAEKGKVEAEKGKVEAEKGKVEAEKENPVDVPKKEKPVDEPEKENPESETEKEKNTGETGMSKDSFDQRREFGIWEKILSDEDYQNYKTMKIDFKDILNIYDKESLSSYVENIDNIVKEKRPISKFVWDDIWFKNLLIEYNPMQYIWGKDGNHIKIDEPDFLSILSLTPSQLKNILTIFSSVKSSIIGKLVSLLP